MEAFKLTGKVLIVTGGTGHLGRATCAAIAAAGGQVAVCSTRQERAEELATHLSDRHGVRAAGFELDLKQQSSINACAANVQQHFGRIDGLVNNAYFGASNNFASMTPQEWNEGLEGAATTPMFMMQACLPSIIEAEGSIVNVSSMYGMVSPDPRMYEGTDFGTNPANYGAGKAALLQLTRYAAVHLAPENVRVNAVSPGPFPNEEVQKNALFVKRLEERVPLRRIGEPEEVGNAIVFLTSEAASFITGHNLVVDGGWTIW